MASIAPLRPREHLPDHDPPARRDGRVRRVVTDRRHLRRLRAQQQIVEAFLDLWQPGRRTPTAAEIAGRAGCSRRTLFDRFSSLHRLRDDAMDYAFSQAVALASHPATHAKADRRTRIVSHVQARVEACERGARYWPLLLAAARDCVDLRHRLRLVRQRTVARLELVYADELSTVSGPARRRLVTALDRLTRPENWIRMRRAEGLSVARVRDAWIGTIDALLPRASVTA